MNRDLHHIDDLFKSGIAGKEETPSSAVWEKIEQELDKKDSRPKFFYWWNARRIAAAALILITSAGLFAGGYYFGNKKESKSVTTEEKRSSSDASNSTGGDELLFNKPTENDDLNSEQNEADQMNTGEPQKKDATSVSKPGKIDGAQQHEASALENRSIEPQIASPDGSASSGKVTASVNKNSPAEKRSGSNPSKDYSVRNGNRPQVSSDKSQPVATSEESFVIAIQSAEPLQNIPAGRTWEVETITAGSLSRGLPETQNQIPLNKTTTVATTRVPAGQAAESIAKKSIPVLNKRNSSVELPRFSFTPVAGFQFGSNRIVTTDDPHANHVKTDIDRTESQPVSISGGILADLKIARNMTIQSGIIFTSRTIEIEPKYVKAERNPDGKVRYKFDCSAGTYYIKKATYARPGDSAMTIFSTNELNYINIPLALTYHFGGKKFSFFATAGAGLNLLTDQYLETGLSNYSYDENESIATNLKSSYFNGMVGAGLQYRPFKKVSFLFSPQYQFAVTPMNENMPVKAYPRIFNMQLGMQIRL